jgi:hypothetical protein
MICRTFPRGWNKLDFGPRHGTRLFPKRSPVSGGTNQWRNRHFPIRNSATGGIRQGKEIANSNRRGSQNPTRRQAPIIRTKRNSDGSCHNFHKPLPGSTLSGCHLQNPGDRSTKRLNGRLNRDAGGFPFGRIEFSGSV